MQGYSNAWKQIIKPPRNNYNEDYDLEWEYESEGVVFERKDYEFECKHLKSLTNQ